MAKGNQEQTLKTPQSTRKEIFNMSKNELAAELEEHTANEAKYHSAIFKLPELKKEVSELKELLNELKSSKETNYNLRQSWRKYSLKLDVECQNRSSTYVGSASNSRGCPIT